MVYNCTRMLDAAFDQPRLAATVMIGFDRPWCIAGGWAIDLSLGRVTREHADVEIALFRQDQQILKHYLPGWQFRVAVSGRFEPWRDRELLPAPLHEIHATSPDGAQIEFLLNECDTIDWIYRRDLRIRRPLDKAIRRGLEGIPVLASEIVLLYKSKSPRACDELDFRVAREELDGEARSWLIRALRKTAPEHPWIAGLE